jgi:hypothetical protein
VAMAMRRRGGAVAANTVIGARPPQALGSHDRGGSRREGEGGVNMTRRMSWTWLVGGTVRLGGPGHLALHNRRTAGHSLTEESTEDPWWLAALGLGAVQRQLPP